MRIVLLVGGYNGANDALAQTLLAPDLHLLRVDDAELACTVIAGFQVHAVVFATDIPADAAVALVRRLAGRDSRPFAVVSRETGARDTLAAAGVICVEAWAGPTVVRDRILDALGVERFERRRPS